MNGWGESWLLFPRFYMKVFIMDVMTAPLEELQAYVDFLHEEWVDDLFYSIYDVAAEERNRVESIIELRSNP